MWRDGSWIVFDEPSRLKHEVVSGGRQVLTWDEVGEVYGDVQLSGVVADSSTHWQLSLHMSGEAGDEDYYYITARDSENGTSLALNRVKNYYYSVLDEIELAYYLEENKWYQVLLNRSGTTLSAKVWSFDEEEPADWQLIAEDRDFDSGRVGISHLYSDVVSEWAYFGVGTGELQAPRAPKDLFDRELVNKTLLQNRVNDINEENLNESDYTEESWQPLQQTLIVAENVLNGPKVKQLDVDAALAALNETYDGLEKAETPPLNAAS